MSNMSEDIQYAGSDTRPPMLDRTDFESWQQRIRLYCLGKDNGENIMKSITEGPFQMGTFIQTPAEDAEETEGALQLGPERARVFTDLSAEEKERYKADIRATNILLQGIPKDIYTLINHYTDAKDIWDNVKMILEGSELTKDDRESYAKSFSSEVEPSHVRLDSDVDEAPNVQTTFMVNLSSEDPIYDEVKPSHNSNTPFEISALVTFDETVFPFPSTKSTTTPSYDFLDDSTDLISTIIRTAPITPVPAPVHTPLVDRAHMVSCNSSRTPVDTKSKLGDGGTPVVDPTLYRSLAGSLQYLTFIRPCGDLYDPLDRY
ncbi:integrase, catalytic region, zinc finger, CCHC-type containing protein [Tanacetum coccineum]